MVPPEWIWWWSSVLSKAAADKTAWPESVRNFNLIGAHKDTNGEWIITLTMEAFAALMIKNNMQKWEAMFTCNFPLGKQIPKTCLLDAERVHKTCLHKAYLLCLGINWHPPFSLHHAPCRDGYLWKGKGSETG